MKTVIQGNFNVNDGIYKMFSSQNLLNTLKNKSKLEQKRGEIEEITAISQINKAKYPEALTHIL